MGRTADLTGKRNGKLVGVKKLEERHPENNQIMWLLQCDCGNTCKSTTSNFRNQTSCGCKNTWHPNYKHQEKSYDGKGYVRVRAPEHPRAHQGRVLEHTLKMERKLGRYLTNDEQVHHINGVKDDNRLSNLELWSTSQPAGQRVKDKIKWAKEILNKYQNL